MGSVVGWVKALRNPPFFAGRQSRRISLCYPGMAADLETDVQARMALLAQFHRLASGSRDRDVDAPVFRGCRISVETKTCSGRTQKFEVSTGDSFESSAIANLLDAVG